MKKSKKSPKKQALTWDNCIWDDGGCCLVTTHVTLSASSRWHGTDNFRADLFKRRQFLPKRRGWFSVCKAPFRIASICHDLNRNLIKQVAIYASMNPNRAQFCCAFHVSQFTFTKATISANRRITLVSANFDCHGLHRNLCKQVANLCSLRGMNPRVHKLLCVACLKRYLYKGDNPPQRPGLTFLCLSITVISGEHHHPWPPHRPIPLPDHHLYRAVVLKRMFSTQRWETSMKKH